MVALAMLMGCGEPVLATEPVLDGARVRLVTSLGDVELQLYGSQAPASTASFVQYVEDGFYDGSDGAGATVFHRVVPNFVVQGGGFSADGAQKVTRSTVVNESGNGIQNTRGRIAMARRAAEDSATSQWFVNLVDNDFLDATTGNNGYTVFGEVTVGLDLFDAMAAQPLSGETPLEPVAVTSASVLP